MVISAPESAATVRLFALRLPVSKSTRAPLLRVMDPVDAEAGIALFVAFRVAPDPTVTPLLAIEPEFFRFNVPPVMVVVPP